METVAREQAILLTGASTGIGWAAAVELDALGFRVFAGVRREEDAERVREHGSPRLVPVMLDVTDAGQIQAAADLVALEVGQAGLWGLVNNAGIAVPGALELLAVDELRRQLEVNVVGPHAVTQAVLPLLRTARGRIVNISSVSGRIAFPYLGAYAASKHALEALSDVLRVELRQWGIEVCLVEPGSVQTPIWEKSSGVAERLRDQVAPEKRALYEEDFAAIRNMSKKEAAGAMPVERVVRVVVHALTAKRPKTRYPVGGNVWVALSLRRLLSDRAWDGFLCRNIGLK